ncbi:hypothetical protein [Labrenzia sp. 011]|uniref:hypothetical protein n=1 Tax=Labrenzia sp. 011 TaxID=2171494 RepID=UPI000D5175AD|nr:hypothetical protein [Labrenzia sp. 011]PVB60423.1 hypothetical protein DCO57_17555 [Labrenzia sp. 011]
MPKPKTIPSVDANAADYWPSVRRKAKLNNALRLADERFDSIQISAIYERWVDDVSSMVRSVAIQCQILDSDDYLEFRKMASETFGLPELRTCEQVVKAEAYEAVQDAHASLYGDSMG